MFCFIPIVHFTEPAQLSNCEPSFWPQSFPTRALARTNQNANFSDLFLQPSVTVCLRWNDGSYFNTHRRWHQYQCWSTVCWSIWPCSHLSTYQSTNAPVSDLLIKRTHWPTGGAAEHYQEKPGQCSSWVQFHLVLNPRLGFVRKSIRPLDVDTDHSVRRPAVVIRQTVWRSAAVVLGKTLFCVVCKHSFYWCQLSLSHTHTHKWVCEVSSPHIRFIHTHSEVHV